MAKKYRLGIDLGGTNIALGIIDEKYNLIYKTSIKTPKKNTGDSLCELMAKSALALISDSSLSEKDIASIGIGFPGLVDSDRGICLFTVNLPFRNTDIFSIFAKYTKIPVRINNDANCAALGEVKAGAAKGRRDAIMLTLGTGVGGGIIIDGKIYSGFNSAAAELGHVVTHKNGKKCGCGLRGCFEQYASATALVNMAALAVKKQGKNTKLYNACKGDTNNLNGRNIFDTAKAGDKTANDVISSYIRELAVGVTNYINIFQPEAVILGGGIANQKEALTDPLKKIVYAECFGKSHIRLPEITYALLGNDAGIIGAAAL